MASVADILFYLVPFLTVNEATSASSVCHFFRATIRAQQPDDVALVRQELLPIKIGYRNEGDEEDPLTNVVFSVHQVHDFRFAIRTTLNPGARPQQVNIRLSNIVWNERGNRQLNSSSPGPTEASFEIKLNGNNQGLVGFGDTDFGGEQSFTLSVDCYGFDTGFELIGLWCGQSVPPQYHADARLALKYLYKCAKQIEIWPDGGPWPSAEYVMRKLHKELHPHFPEDFDWKAPHQDVRPNVELVHRKAYSLEAWTEEMPGPLGEVTAYRLEKLPWYGDYLRDKKIDQLEGVVQHLAATVGHLEATVGSLQQENVSLKRQVEELKKDGPDP